MFNEKKVTQAVAILLDKAEGKMKFIKMLKLIYLADRIAFAKRGKSISDDEYYSMFHGPVPSNTYNLIQYGNEKLEEGSVWIKDMKSFGENWIAYIKDAEDHKIQLKKIPEFEKLSKYELYVLNKVYEEFGGFGAWELVDWMHENLPEWDEVERGRRLDLPDKQILQEGLKKSKKETERITREKSIHQKADELFA